MRFASMIKCSCSDWPGHVAAVLFTQGCNMSCAFCSNYRAFVPETTDFDEIDALNYLRALPVDHVVICGGEPTIQPHLVEFLKNLHDIGWHIKLDTNGSDPVTIERCLPYLDYVAVDLKTAPDYYFQLTGQQIHLTELFHTLDKTSVTVEYRTLLVNNPWIDVDTISELIPIVGKRKWTLNTQVIADGYGGNQFAWTEKEISELQKSIKEK